MVRLTFKDGRGRNAILVNGMEIHGQIADCLAAYEDTGLTPKEIGRVVETLHTVQNKKRELFEAFRKYLDAEVEGRIAIIPCRVDDLLFEIDRPEYGLIMCKVLWIDHFVGPACHVEGNEQIRATTCTVIVIEGHGKGSCYTFEASDFGKTVFLTREAAEAELEKQKGGRSCGEG